MPAVYDEVRPGQHALEARGPGGGGEPLAHGPFRYVPAACAQLAHGLQRGGGVPELVRAEKRYGVLRTPVAEALAVHGVGELFQLREVREDQVGARPGRFVAQHGADALAQVICGGAPRP